MAIRLADRCINYLIEKAMIKDQQCASIGLWEGNIGFMNMEDFTRNIDLQFQRPKNQWWISLIPIAKSLI
jgi:6-phosphofructokinase 1